MARRLVGFGFPAVLTRSNNKVTRIVMVGKTGVGKSATGNTILGRKSFESDFSPESLTKDCAKEEGEVDGQKVAVIDTPGLFDTSTDESTTKENIGQCIKFASPGPHVFLIVIRLGRFTEEEKKTVEKIQELFGERANKHSMVLFTGGDQLKQQTIEQFLEKSKDLQELVAKCNDQYHVFNNELTDGSQASELLEKIKTITEKNGGSHYTNEMFQAAERAIEEETKRILKQKEEEMQKEIENIRRELKEEHEEKMKEMEKRFGNELAKVKFQMMVMKFENSLQKTEGDRIKELEKQKQRQARDEAEKKTSIWGKIGAFFKKPVGK